MWRALAVLMFLLLVSGCTSSGEDSLEDMPRKVVQIGEQFIIGQGEKQVKVSVDKVILKTVDLPDQYVEYSVEGFNFFKSGNQGDNLFIIIKVEGIGNNPFFIKPTFMRINSYNEEIWGGTSASHVDVKKGEIAKSLMVYRLREGDRESVANVVFKNSSDELIIIPIQLSTLFDSIEPVEYLKLPDYCYQKEPSWQKKGVYFDIPGKLATFEGKTVTPDDLYQWYAECLMSLDDTIKIEGNFPDGKLCYGDDCKDMYQYLQEGITVPESIGGINDAIVVKNSFCWDLRDFVSSSIISGEHYIGFNE